MLHHRKRTPSPTSRLEPVAGMLLLVITVGLVGKVCTANAATTTARRDATAHGAAGSISAAVSMPSDTPAQHYFDAVAREDQENFIKYHLDQALEQRIPNYRGRTPKDFEFTSFQDALEPEDFSVNLLDHFMGTFGLTEVHVYEFVALNVICFPSGWCFNPDDVGNICCPF